MMRKRHFLLLKITVPYSGVGFNKKKSGRKSGMIEREILRKKEKNKKYIEG